MFVQADADILISGYQDRVSLRPEVSACRCKQYKYIIEGFQLQEEGCLLNIYGTISLKGRRSGALPETENGETDVQTV